MFYVIMDLEWNNSYNKYRKCFVNEILEIRAVMVNDELEVIDTFSAIIRSQLIKKLSGRVKNRISLQWHGQARSARIR